MPTVSEYDGIKIKIWVEFGIRYHTPHFHAFYGGEAASFNLINLEVIDRTDGFPGQIENKVREWAMAHRSQLKKNWYRLKHHKPIAKI